MLTFIHERILQGSKKQHLREIGRGHGEKARYAWSDDR